MPRKEGATIDLLVPMLPTSRDAFMEVFSTGFDHALSESNSYWQRRSARETQFHFPERPLNEFLSRSIQMTGINAELNPDTGEYGLLSGSLMYVTLWGTPTVMNLHMLLDPYGYPDEAARYLKIFQQHQGTRKPPAHGLEKHPGYLGVPEALKPVDWMTDHGAILYAMAYHALVTNDTKFIDDYTETLVRACEFIRDARDSDHHNGITGLMPPGAASDVVKPEQAVWTDGWNYKGLTAALEVLRRIKHPRAEEFAIEAREYKQLFVKAFLQRTEEMPKWRDAAGRSYPLIPSAMIGAEQRDGHHPFYLDTGPLFLVYAGLMDADDPTMRTATAFFRKGPNQSCLDPEGHLFQPPALTYELSSCEPCYSWNIFHSLQRRERTLFLQGMYSMLAGGVSRDTFIGSETRHGISGTLFPNPLAAYLMRLAVIDDHSVHNELHFLRMTPLHWLAAEGLHFQRMPTIFGPVDMKCNLDADAKTLRVNLKTDFHHAPAKTVLHIPPVKGVETLVINGQSQPVPNAGFISIE